MTQTIALDDRGFDYGGLTTLNFHHEYLLPTVRHILREERRGKAPRIFDLGCGNGSVCAHLASLGYEVAGVDPSQEGIALAKRTFPGLRLELGSAYDDLAATYGTFPMVLSLEVVEHVYDPMAYAQCLHDLVEPGGVAIISTPYHGYFKNLALALTGKLDGHFTALWPHGHIKFWSVRTLSFLLVGAGFRDVEFHRVGRVPAFAKSMIAVARKA